MKKIHVLLLTTVLMTIAAGAWLLSACDPPTENDPNFITVTSDKYEMPADKTSTAEITVVVYDNTHVAVVDGTAVYLSTNCGTVSPSVCTTAGGQTTATLTAGDVPCDAVVHADVPSENRQADSAAIDMYDTGAELIQMWADPPQIKADGIQITTITVFATRDGETPVDDGTEVKFNASDGTLSATTATTAHGYAYVDLKSGTTPVLCQVTAVIAALSKTITVEFTSSSATNIVVTSNTNNIRADGTSKATITAEVWLKYGVEHVADGTKVFFTTDKGTISPTETTTSNGFAFATLTSSTTAGTATIWGTSGGYRDSCQVYFYEDGAAGLTLTVVPSSIPADGTSWMTVTARVRNGYNEPVSGVTVNFTATRGTLSSPTATTDDTGAATVRLTSGTTPDPDVRVTAVAGSASAVAHVAFTQATSGEVSYVDVAIQSNEIYVGFDPDEDPNNTICVPEFSYLYPKITIYVKNEFHQGIAGKTVIVQIQPPCGTIIDLDCNSADIGITDADGVYECYLKTEYCTVSGVRTITGKCDSVTGTGVINFLPEKSCNLTLNSDSGSIDGNLGGSTTLRLTLTDRYGNAVQNGYTAEIPIDAMPSGITIQPSIVTFYSGAATSTFIVDSGTADQSVTVEAEANDPSQIDQDHNCIFHDVVMIDITN